MTGPYVLPLSTIKLRHRPWNPTSSLEALSVTTPTNTHAGPGLLRVASKGVTAPIEVLVALATGVPVW